MPKCKEGYPDGSGGVTYPCMVCSTLIAAGAPTDVSRWRYWAAKLRLARPTLSAVPEATVGITIRPTKDHYMGSRNVKVIRLCSKHHRMLLGAFDSMLG